MAEAGWMAGWIREISPRWMEKQLRNRRNTGFPRSAALAYVGDWFWEWEQRSTKKIFHCLHALIVNMLRIDDIYRLSLTCNYCQLSCFYKNWHTLNYQMSLAPFTAVNRKKGALVALTKVVICCLIRRCCRFKSQFKTNCPRTSSIWYL